MKPDSDPSMPAPQAMAVAMLDGLPWPVWVCREDARVDFANAATRVSGEGGPLAVRWGRLAGPSAADTNMVERALHRVAADGRCDPVDLAGRGDGRPIRIHVAGIPRGTAFASVWPQAVALVTPLAPAAPGASDAGTVLARLAERFSLTKRETVVLGDLAQGLTVAEIATRRHVERVTVRTHLRSLFDKTDRRRQAELVRLVVGG